MDPAVFISIVALAVAAFGQWWQIVRDQSRQARERDEDVRLKEAEERAQEAHRLALIGASAEFDEAGFSISEGEQPGLTMYRIQLTNVGGSAARNLSADIEWPAADGYGMVGGPLFPRIESGAQVVLEWPLDSERVPFLSGLPEVLHRPVIGLNYTDGRGERRQILGQQSEARVTPAG